MVYRPMIGNNSSTSFYVPDNRRQQYHLPTHFSVVIHFTVFTFCFEEQTKYVLAE